MFTEEKLNKKKGPISLNPTLFPVNLLEKTSTGSKIFDNEEFQKLNQVEYNAVNSSVKNDRKKTSPSKDDVDVMDEMRKMRDELRTSNTASLLEFAKKYNYDIPDVSSFEKMRKEGVNDNKQKTNIYGNQSFSDYIAADIDRKLGATSHRRQQQQKSREDEGAVPENGGKSLKPRKSNEGKSSTGKTTQKPIKSKIQLKGLRNVTQNTASKNSNKFSSMSKDVETGKVNVGEETNKMLKCLSDIENEFQALKNQSSSLDMKDVAKNMPTVNTKHMNSKGRKNKKVSPDGSTSGSRSPVIEELDDEDYYNELNSQKKVSPLASNIEKDTNSELNQTNQCQKENEIIANSELPSKNTESILKRRIRNGLKSKEDENTQGQGMKEKNRKLNFSTIWSSLSFSIVDDYVSKCVAKVAASPPYRDVQARITQGMTNYKVNERLQKIQNNVSQFLQNFHKQHEDDLLYQSLMTFANAYLVNQHELCENILHFDILYLPLFFMISTKLFLPHAFIVNGFLIPKLFMMIICYSIYRVYTKYSNTTYQLLVTFFSLATTFVLSIGLVHLLSPRKADITVQFLHFFAFFPLYFILFSIITLATRVQLLNYFIEASGTTKTKNASKRYQDNNL